MRRDIDPIKIIKILPLSNRPGGPPGQPGPWLVFLKKVLRATREASVRMLTTLRGQIARARPPLQSVYERLVSRAQPETREKSPDLKAVCEPDERSVAPSARPGEGSPEREVLAPSATSIWFTAIRESALKAWQSRRARLAMMKRSLANATVFCGHRIRQAWETRPGWRNKTAQVVRPLTSAVRVLRQRHQRLLDQLNSTHSLIQSQQQEITELAFQLASVQTEMAAHKKTIDELTRQLHLLQATIAQSLPATHGTTGQSGPSSHGRRGTTATKRSGPSEPGAQSRAEH